MIGLDKYRALELRLFHVRQQHKFAWGTPAEDPILDEMDVVWDRMTDAERLAINASVTPAQDRFYAHVDWVKQNEHLYDDKWIVLNEESVLLGTFDCVDIAIAQARTHGILRPFIHHIGSKSWQPPSAS